MVHQPRQSITIQIGCVVFCMNSYRISRGHRSLNLSTQAMHIIVPLPDSSRLPRVQCAPGYVILEDSRSKVNCVGSIWRAAAGEGSCRRVPMLTAGVRGLNESAQCAPSMINSSVIRSGNTSFSTIVLAFIGCLMDAQWLSFWTTYNLP